MMKRCIIAVVFGLCSPLLFPDAALADEPNVKLKEVVVTATKTEKDPQDVTQSVTVITADEIKKSGATTAGQAIERTVGVDLRDYGSRGSSSEISLRGSTTSQVLVLLDGRRLNSSQSGAYDFSNLPVPLENIERIEIVRGPSSALYGADALGGVINIITKKPQKKIEAAMTGQGGSHGYWALDAVGSGRLGNAYYSLFGGKDASSGYRVNSDYDKTLTGGKIGYDFSKDTSLELAANYSEKEIGTPGSTSYPSATARQWNRNADGGLVFRSKPVKDLDMRFGLNGYQYKLLYPSEQSTHKTNGASTELQINWLSAPSSLLTNLLTVGTEVKADRIESSQNGDHSSSLWAVYIQDELSIGEPFVLILGGRYDEHSVYEGRFSPRASARYLISKTNTIIRASAGRAFRAPTFNDLYWPTTAYTAGNSDLKPEKSVEYEGSVEQQIVKGSSVKMTVFERHVKDMITWRPDASFVWRPTNFSSARITGFEAEAKVTLLDAIVLGANYLFMDTWDQDNGEYISGAPAEQIKSYLNITIPRVKTNVYIEGRYERNYWVPSLGASNPTKHYVVGDIKILQPLTLGPYLKTDLFAGVKNFTNERYEVSGGYPMPRRAEFYGGMTVRF
jgi:outer membrane cobalamin receptor